MHGKGTATKASYPVQVTTVKGRTASASGDWHSVADAQVQANPTATTTYGYDALYRLTKNTTSYTYDRADRIQTAGATSYTVDANGNLTARGSDSFAYDQANRLKSATIGGTTSTYGYDGDGKRVGKTVAGTTTSYVYDPNNSLPDVLTDGTLKYVYGNGLAYAVDSSGDVQVYHTDGLGSVRAITDVNGNVIQTYQADEFGVPTQTQGTSSQPFQYTGQQHDAETGLYFLRARMYDPSIGRFLTQDPFPGSLRGPLSLNRYAYAEDSPVSLLDPLGLYEYRHEWYIGPASRIGSPESAMAYFQQHPRGIFPFSLGQCDVIRLNERCDLVIANVGAGPLSHNVLAPVRVMSVSATSFTFTALPGHFDPPGATITFSIFRRDGNIYLSQKARALRSDEGSVPDRATALIAWVTWDQMASNLARALDPLLKLPLVVA